MNLEKAFEILKKHAEKCGLEFPSDKQNGYSFEGLIISDWYVKHYPEKNLTQQDIERVTLADRQGGEDCGSYYHIILKVKDDETGEEGYIRWVGHYDSWNGTDWYNDPEMVVPVQKVVTVTEWHVVE